jgi:hypothetical protein
MTATRAVHSTPTACPVLYVAFELSWGIGSWRSASARDGHPESGPFPLGATTWS